MSMLDYVQKLIDNLTYFRQITKQAALKQILAHIQDLLNHEGEQLKAAELMQKLITVEIIDPTVMKQNINTCLIICSSEFPRVGTFLLSELWKRSFTSENRTQNGLILKHFIDDFIHELGAEVVLCRDLCVGIQTLLYSNQIEDRRSANNLLRKVLDMKESQSEVSRKLIHKAINNCADHLLSYKTIMEWLESPKKEEYWIFWISKLSVKFVSNEDTDVLFGTLEYFLDHVTPRELREANLLSQFFQATNNLDLHNLEGYFLPEQKMLTFLADVDNDIILEYFCGLSWHGVPLIRWLDCLRSANQCYVDEGQLLTICEQVRNLKNPYLRKAGQSCIFKHFQNNIESMALNVYLNFVETLFDNSESVSDEAVDKLKSKIDNCSNMTEDIKYLNKRRFDLICGNEFTYDLEDLYSRLIKKFEAMKTNKYGWWRLPAFFSLYKAQKVDFFVTEYKVNLQSIEKCKTIRDLQKYLVAQLRCNWPNEEEYVERRCVDLFVTSRLTEWNQLEELSLNSINILKNGTIHSFSHLAHLLGNCQQPQPLKILLTFVNHWKQNTSALRATEGILKYLNANLTSADTQNIAYDMIIACKENYRTVMEILRIVPNVWQSTLIPSILYGEATTGDERIENAYCVFNWAVEISARPLYIRCIEYMPKVSIFKLFDALLSYNSEVMKNEVYRVSNSKEYRVILRIVYTMLRIYPYSRGYWSDQLWILLLKQDSHTNISYFYECLVALHLPNLTPLLDKIRDFANIKSYQQDSLVSVVHIYLCNRKSLNLEELKEVFQELCNQMEHLNSQSKLLTLLVLGRLEKKYQGTRINMPNIAALETKLKNSEFDQVLEYYMEARLMLPKILLSKNCCPANIICYMTYAPFDEYEFPIFLSSKKQMSKVNEIRDGFRNKTISLFNSDASLKDSINKILK